MCELYRRHQAERQDSVGKRSRYVAKRALPMLFTLMALVPGARAASVAGHVGPLSRCTVEASGRQLNAFAGEGVTFTSTLGAIARETIVITDSHGGVVKHLVDRCAAPGGYDDSWNGTDDRGERVLDGLYRWVATFDDGIGTFTIDQSGELDGDFELKSHPEYNQWKPFENEPLRVRHTFERPGEVVLVFSRDTYYVRPSCEPPKFFCRFLDGFQPAGEFEYDWAGVDDTGARRSDIHGIMVISHHERLPRNGIVVYGGSPRIRDVLVSPTLYRPDSGPQEISFWLTLPAGGRATAVVSITNQESRSCLKRITLPEVMAGRVTTSWDGRTDSGIRSAPGQYTVSVRVTDSLAHAATGEILTVLEY